MKLQPILLATDSTASADAHPPRPIRTASFTIAPTFFLPSLGAALPRSRRFEVDVIIGRTLVYAALTLALGLVYIGGIAIGWALVALLIDGSELSIVVSILTIVATTRNLKVDITVLQLPGTRQANLPTLESRSLRHEPALYLNSSNAYTVL